MAPETRIPNLTAGVRFDISRTVPLGKFSNFTRRFKITKKIRAGRTHWPRGQPTLIRSEKGKKPPETIKRRELGGRQFAISRSNCARAEILVIAGRNEPKRRNRRRIEERAPW